MPDDEVKYNILIPFTQVQSVGGLYDDASFVAGWMIGNLWQLLAQFHKNWNDQDLLYYRCLDVQVDLIVMHYGLVSEVLPGQSEDPEALVYIRITKPEGKNDDNLT